MKDIRKMYFSGSWYPSDKSQVLSQFRKWESYSGASDRGTSCIVPHAGWFYSGKLAYSAIKKLDCGSETVVIAGGHLPSGSGIGIPPETSWETPLGNLEIDTSLAEKLKNEFHTFNDLHPDNTVEIQLPMVRHFFKNCRILPIRLPPDKTAMDFAEFIFSMNIKRIAVIGSTDLSHYGPNYNYTPYGTGIKAEEKIRNEIDAKLVKYLLDMDCKSALDWAYRSKSACSAGAAVCSAYFALLSGKSGKLADYYTSADIIRDESFVGYAGIYYS